MDYEELDDEEEGLDSDTATIVLRRLKLAIVARRAGHMESLACHARTSPMDTIRFVAGALDELNWIEQALNNKGKRSDR